MVYVVELHGVVGVRIEDVTEHVQVLGMTARLLYKELLQALVVGGRILLSRTS